MFHDFVMLILKYLQLCKVAFFLSTDAWFLLFFICYSEVLIDLCMSCKLHISHHSHLWAEMMICLLRCTWSDSLEIFNTGHGRSVCVMCAVLVALGLAEDWKAAEKVIGEKRPFIKLNALHRKSLEEWSKHRLSPQRNGLSLVTSSILSDNSSRKWFKFVE